MTLQEQLRHVLQHNARLAEELDEARFAAGAMWDFIREGCFLDELPMGAHGSPERELWIKSLVAKDVEQEILKNWPPEGEAKSNEQ